MRGFRGAPPADAGALVDLLHRLSPLAEDLPEVAELDLNPVLALPDSCVAVDARVRIPRPCARRPRAGRPTQGNPQPGLRSCRFDVRVHDALLGVVSLLLGLLVAVLGFFALMMWLDARNAKDAANAQLRMSPATTACPGWLAWRPAQTLGGLGPSSFAGAAPANADELAAAHKPYPAELPAAPAGPSRTSTSCSTTDRPDRPRRQVPAWAWAGGAPDRHPCSPGPARQDHADERRRDPAFRRLPRRPHRAGQGVRRRCRASRSATRSARTIRASSCTTAGPSRS